MGYLGGGGALSLQTHNVWGQAGKYLSGFPQGERTYWGRTAPSPRPCGAFNVRSGASGLPKVRWSCSDRYSSLGESQTLRLVRTSKIAKFDFVADWGHKSTFWVIFLAVKKYFKMDFPSFSPQISFSRSIVTQRKQSIPATPHGQAEMTLSK